MKLCFIARLSTFTYRASAKTKKRFISSTVLRKSSVNKKESGGAPAFFLFAEDAFVDNLLTTFKLWLMMKLSIKKEDTPF
jgi:hypothetical protein